MARRARTAFGLLALSLAALVLSGCFTSAAPLYDPTRGACPFRTATTLEVIQDGEREQVVFAPDGPYCRTATGQAPSQSLFVPFGRNRWIVQDATDPPVSYSLMVKDGETFRFYIPQCVDYPKPDLHRAGIEQDKDSSNCTVTSSRQLEAVFRDRAHAEREPAAVYRVVTGP